MNITHPLQYLAIPIHTVVRFIGQHAQFYEITLKEIDRSSKAGLFR